MSDLKGTLERAGFYLPQTPEVNWPKVLADPSVPIVCTDNFARAAEMCRMGVPAIGVRGCSEQQLAALLRVAGADVTVGKTRMH